MCSISARSRFIASTRGAGLGQRQLQLQPRERRAQVVADRGQQGGALVDVALDALLHGEEGVAGLPHLARAVGLERRTSRALAEGLRRGRQPLDGAHLVADEQRRRRAVSSTVARVSQKMKMWPWVAKARSRGAMMRSTPSCGTFTRMST